MMVCENKIPSINDFVAAYLIVKYHELLKSHIHCQTRSKYIKIYQLKKWIEKGKRRVNKP